MSFTTFSALSLLASLPSALAWGTLGHETVALIAQNYVSDDTASWAQGILDITNDTYLATVSTWADSYRYTSAGSFSEPYHFIDANDDPPSSCNVDYDRDCGDGGCVVSAIQNYTQVDYALRFIIHFVGDIHQPLHDEALEVGGNDIDVTWDGDDNNLHHIWDTEMPEKKVGGYTMSDAQSWAKSLSSEIDSGSYSSDKDGWLDGIDLSDPVTTAMGWATDSNAYVCSTVMPDGVSAVEKGDLDGDYYDSAIPIIELQIARAGYRLAAWLNLIATGETSLKICEMDLTVGFFCG
ncbi:nuclease S1 [Rhizodiscina lignyota]|uniref:Nuclease S1 n=1 Tax=Rhizodiscina lignyota TaxID=1504668 RepID=A0A9P4I098_9PEZI|nr:nuclease S1 [Rhizodiscina lignyota]